MVKPWGTGRPMLVISARLEMCIRDRGLTYDAGSTHTAARVSCWGYLREGEDTMLIPVENSCQFTGEFAIVWK